jgi:16S rRNA processing protein RimM
MFPGRRNMINVDIAFRMSVEILNLKKIGFISKLNGYKGELMLVTEDDKVSAEKFLFMKMDGIPVPFFIEDIFEKSGNFVVKLEDVNDEVFAQRFLNHDVFVERKGRTKNPKVVSAHELIDYHIIDSTFGDLGPIVRVEDFPQQEIAICNLKNKEIMVPLNDEFIDDIDDEHKLVSVTLPEGLVDLYLS